MKKIIMLILVIILTCGVFSGCTTTNPTGNNETQKADIKVATLKGPTGMGMVRIMEDNANGITKNNYEFTLAGAPDEIVAKVTTGEADVAAVPTNLAATLYNKTQGKYIMAAINTLGVLYIVQQNTAESGEIKNISDLKGKTIYITGQGSTPEFALDYILKQNGIDTEKDLKIEYKTEHSELATLLTTGKVEIALLPEPFVTQVINSGKISVRLDIAEEWKKVTSDTPLAMGAVIVKKEFADNNKAALDNFLDEYKNSVEYVNSSIEESASLIGKFEIMPEAVAKKAIKKCNIVFIDGDQMADSTNRLLSIFAAADIKSVGGKLPDDGFYYKK